MEGRNLLLLLFFVMGVKYCESFGPGPLKYDMLYDGQVNTLYNFSVTNNDQVVVQYSLNHPFQYNLQTGEVRLEVEVVDMNDLIFDDDCPLLVTLSQGKQVTSWDISYKIKKMAKTVCIDPSQLNATSSKTYQVVVVASSCNILAIHFTIKLTYVPKFLEIPISGSINTIVSPTTPRYFRFEFPTNVETVLIKLSSEDEECMTLSVQKPQCPVFDDESNVRFAGYWQTFTKKAGITIEKKNFPSGLFLVLVTNLRDEGCSQKDGYNSANADNRRLSLGRISQTNKKKRVAVTINRVPSQGEYVWPTLFPLVIYLPIIILTFVIFVTFHRMSVRDYQESDDKYDSQCFLTSTEFMCASHDHVDGQRRKKIEHSAQRYFWLLITVALFYCIPVFQLIINYLGIVYRTGEQDICYYNNLCSLPLNKIMDFNHIYSNVGYVIFGLIFILFTYVRQRKMDAQHQDTTLFKNQFGCWEGHLIPKLIRRPEYGTFVHYGLFYSLGFALFMEGFLSAGYHICPNKANFQFDTSFMYAMAVLSYVKVYQFRHGFYMNELMAFFLLALVVGCVVLGLISAEISFRIVLSLCHLVLVVLFQFYLLYIGRSHRGSNQLIVSFRKVIWGIAKELCGIYNPYETPFLVRGHPNKSLFWWTIVWNILLVINSWTLVYGSNFATQVLYILLANLALYVLYYFIMKLIHGEFQGILKCGPSVQPLVFGTISLIFWIPGMYYFMNPLSTWDVSPSESRLINDDCIVLQFYDNHDIWHLLSAPALFFSFMVFLTLDDGLIGVHQKCIPIF